MPISTKQLSLCDVSSEFNPFINSTEDSILSVFKMLLIFLITFRDFCGFNSVPNKSQFSRFKNNYYNDYDDSWM
ncbi:hypothetical protein AN1V17_42930 [Vallitalea sediminicola]